MKNVDREFFERVADLKNKMYAIAFAYMGSQSSAVDMVDEAVYRGYIKKSQLRDPKFLETWMIRILINECNKELKKRRREPATDVIPERADESYFDSLPLKEAIKALPKDMKEIIVLRYFAGYSVVETAELLNMPQGTIATKSRKALTLLKVEMGDRNDG